MFQEEKQNSFIIHPLQVMTDNIVWIWTSGNKAVVIDPSKTKPVKEWLISRKMNLEAILQTHHHEDHIGGTKGLIDLWPTAKIIASKYDKKRIPLQTISVKDGEDLILMNFQIKILEIPGHTNTHIAFYLNSKEEAMKKPALFCGDTLFAGGCGRIFEGTSKIMYRSLQKINSLPLETQIYCGHEYTELNLKWAYSLYPNSITIRNKLQEVIEKRKNGIITLPTNLLEERKINLFLRAKSVEEFTYLRKHKDNWSY